MDHIGIINPELWTITQKIALQSEYPQKQQEHCPYIIIKQINQEQLLALAGHFKSQQIHLFIVEVCSPSLETKNRVPIPNKDWDEARKHAQELLSRAVKHLQLKSSTNNQPSNKQP